MKDFFMLKFHYKISQNLIYQTIIQNLNDFEYHETFFKCWKVLIEYQKTFLKWQRVLIEYHKTFFKLQRVLIEYHKTFS